MLVGLTGRMGAGKDTVYKILSAKLKNKETIKRLAFGDAVKKSAYAIFGGEKSKYFGTQEDKNEKLPFWEDKLGEAYSTYRRIAQTFGTEICRNNIHKDIWVLALEPKIQELLKEGISVVVTDIRFDNEAKLIKSYGGLVVEVVNTNNNHAKDLHASEEGVSPNLIDLQMVAGSLYELDQSVETFLNEFVCSPSRS